MDLSVQKLQNAEFSTVIILHHFIIIHRYGIDFFYTIYIFLTTNLWTMKL